MQANHKPDIGDANSRKPDQVPQKILRNQPRSIRERPGDQQSMKIEEQRREAKTHHSYTRDHATAVAIEPDRTGQPEKRHQIEDRERKRNDLQQRDWLK